MRPNLALALMVILPVAACLMSIFMIAGCGQADIPRAAQKEEAKKEASPKEPAQAEATKPAAPFPEGGPGIIEKTVGRIADASKGEVSALSAEKLGNLHLSGWSLLLLAIVARFLFGSWKHALLVPAIGITISAGAVLLTDYPRVVLLIPLCWLVFLIIEFVRKAAGWRRGAKAFDAAATVIEMADTGPKSTGQLIKNKIKDAGAATVVNAALKPLEKMWETYNQQ